MSAGFGDNVRIKIAPATEAVGIAGRSGIATGMTTPSVTGVSVVGEITDDCAISVMFEDPGQQVWLAPELVEFVDHAPGTTITLKGVPQIWTRGSKGKWTSRPRKLPPSEWIAWIRARFRRWTGKNPT